jgi:MoaA/NifB/PqqE/SkfB family radical SAM enzyme
MYINLKNIKTIQLDHTSRCNLGCPQCARMWNEGKELNPKMPITDLTLDDYKILLQPFNKDVTLFHCGNYGDALASPTFDETFEYSLEHVKKIRIATNGSLRTPDWWTELAKKGKDKLYVIFSIDGLIDTNHLYRVGSNFKKIMENAHAFIQAGGEAEWAFIEFEHNYHQIESARQIATDMGFKKFSVKYTARFADNNETTIKTKKGNVVKDKVNHNTDDKQKILKTYTNFDEYVNNTTIKCKYQQSQTVFVDMCMGLWPCCWMGAPAYFNHKTAQTKSFEHIWNMYGKDFNNMRIHGWDVLQHDFFQNYLDKSWNAQTDNYKRIYTCGRTCGNKFEFSSGHGKNIKKESINE